MSGNDLTVIERALDRAKSERSAALAKLKNTDGSPIFAPREEARRRDEAEAKYRRARREANEQLAEIIKQAESNLAASGVGDPLLRLDDAELDQAARLREFISEDVERLPVPTLIERIKLATEADDRVRVALFIRAGRLALASRFSPREDSTPVQRAQALSQAGPLRAALDQAEVLLVDAEARDEAQARLDMARALQNRDVASDYVQSVYGA